MSDHHTAAVRLPAILKDLADDPRIWNETVRRHLRDAASVCEALLRMEAALRGLSRGPASDPCFDDCLHHGMRKHSAACLDARAALSPRTPQADGET